MKKLLFIDHSFHNKTGSSQFIKDILCGTYYITEFNFDPYTDKSDKFFELKDLIFDVVVLWQVMPEMKLIKDNVKFKHIAFFPMYDGAPRLNDPIWYQYKDCNIINFSKTLHDECIAYGLSSYYVQYFPEPKNISDWGNEKSVFLWQRINLINPNTVDKVVGFENIDRFYHHQVPDPEHRVIETEKKWKNKVEVSTWFGTKEEMEKHLQKGSVYFAPRHLEGIGMSFLEAMSMGRCVVAPNNPTMNEYIKDGINGFLYDPENPERIELRDVRTIQKKAVDFIKNGYAKWSSEKHKILDWIVADVSKNRNDKLLTEKYVNASPDYPLKRSLPYRVLRKVYRMIKKTAKLVVGKR